MAQNELEKTLGKVIDQKVMPELKKVSARMDKIEEKLDATFDAIGDLKVDVTEIQEDISDMGYTTERIETRLNSVIKDHDDMSLKTRQLNHRVLKLETKKA
ncbi:hypothetical protein A2V71_01810 [Candidatus Berkelbacteria bacterium RBG_13_40_8]|uniref:t-SNARE coiled-coil homology domain-containing protein n=1 Tax=Candidatus Berkelbacteria bacterium RBG_13_40_8 TaxID=1797467 RepID=A0A1F5DPQ1_9BACT|nr:MAG: hypothetical protein A2V71_01810 [Candidatus Berkelbacteria bacterium RBG_13_40_8]